jgi:hypothetical protein
MTGIPMVSVTSVGIAAKSRNISSETTPRAVETGQIIPH